MSLSRKILVAALAAAAMTLLAASWIYYNLTLVEEDTHHLSRYTVEQALTAGHFDIDVQRAVGSLEVIARTLPHAADNALTSAQLRGDIATANAAIDAAQHDLDRLDQLEASRATTAQHTSSAEQVALQQVRVALLVDMRTKLLDELKSTELPTEAERQQMQVMINNLANRATVINQDSTDLTNRDVAATVALVEQSLGFTDFSVVLSFLIMAGLVVLSPYLMQRFIVHPLHLLSAAASAVTHGDLEQQVRETHKDEIGELQRSFNLMVASLREQQATLHQRNSELEHKQAALAAALEEVRRLSDERTSLLERTVERLSAPVLPVLSGVLVMPVIGTVDARRAELLQRTLLEQIAQQQAHITILDLTGLSNADTIVAHALVELVQGASLLGAQPVIVGVSPKLAAALVTEGLDSRRVRTMADLQAAVLYALGQQNPATPHNGNRGQPNGARNSALLRGTKEL